MNEAVKYSSVIIVDQDNSTFEQIKKILPKEITIDWAETPERALNMMEVKCYDIVVTELDFNLMDGIEFCRKIRQEIKQESVIIFLSGNEENYIQLSAYNAGADDYILKPINGRLFLSKLTVWLKRIHCCTPVKQVSSNGSIEIDREKYLVSLKGKKYSLPPKEFEMVDILASTPGKIYSRLELRSKIWGDDLVNNRTIDVHIRKLREKFGYNFIRTIKGVGYKIEI
jgi:two-component system, OmpR family, alkaline phosphatase synthesis response regulator PhoP